MRKYTKELFVCLILALIVLGVFWQVRNFGLIYFDDHAVIDYAARQSIENGFHAREAFTKGPVFPYRTPITMLSHMLDCVLFGHNYGLHHLVNLVIHLVNVILLFFIFRIGSGKIWRSACLAGLFAIHPVNVEPVAWLTARVCILNGTFVLLTMLLYFYYAKQPGLLRYSSVVFLFICGLLTKPEVAYMPFVLILMDVWPLNRVDFGGGTGDGTPAILSDNDVLFVKRRPLSLLTEKLPFLLIAAGYVALALFLYKSMPFYGSVSIAGVITSWIDNAPLIYFLYLLIFFFPGNLDFFQAIPSAELLKFQGTGGLVIVFLLITVLIARRARKHRYLIIGWFWFLGTISIPVLVNVSQHNFLTYRYAYIPGIGVLVMAVWGGYDLIKKVSRPKTVAGILIAVLFPALMLFSWKQAGCWKNMLTLCQCGDKFGAAAKPPEWIYYNFANMLMDRGLPDDAVVYYMKALERAPDNAHIYEKLGSVYARQRKMRQAFTFYQKALELSPQFALAHNNLGNLLIEAGDINGAITHYKMAIAAKPSEYKILNNLASALAQQGRRREAIVYLEKALEIDPQYETARENLKKLTATSVGE